jgi:hypothetical protein
MGPFMPLDVAGRCADFGDLFLKSYQALAVDAVRCGRVAYKLRPKLHYCWHLFSELRRTGENPRRQDLFDAEDYIGKIKRVAAKCHARTASLRTVQRIIAFLVHRWHKAARPPSATNAT